MVTRSMRSSRALTPRDGIGVSRTRTAYNRLSADHGQGRKRTFAPITPALWRALSYLNDEVIHRGTPTRLPAPDTNGARIMPP